MNRGCHRAATAAALYQSYYHFQGQAAKLRDAFNALPKSARNHGYDTLTGNFLVENMLCMAFLEAVQSWPTDPHSSDGAGFSALLENIDAGKDLLEEYLEEQSKNDEKRYKKGAGKGSYALYFPGNDKKSASAEFKTAVNDNAELENIRDAKLLKAVLTHAQNKASTMKKQVLSP